MLWGMINALQIIAHLPFFNVTLPYNVVMMVSFILEVANFNVVPADDILIYLGMGNEVDEEEEGEEDDPFSLTRRLQEDYSDE